MIAGKILLILGKELEEDSREKTHQLTATKEKDNCPISTIGLFQSNNSSSISKSYKSLIIVYRIDFFQKIIRRKLYL